MRQLLIGVDAMEWTLVRRWAEEGKLPAFRQLLNQGLAAELTSCGDSLPDAVWTTFSYGVNAGKLEKYFYVQYDPTTSALKQAKDSDLKGTPFWEECAKNGRQVIVVDLPHTPLREGPRIIQIANWGTHQPRDDSGGVATVPSSLRSAVKARFGAHPVGECDRYESNINSQVKLYHNIISGVAKHGELFRWLMMSRDWDLFVCCFSGAHCAGHHFWSYMQNASQLGSGHLLNDALEHTYKAIDHEIGLILDAAGTETRSFVFAPHGMGGLSHASWNLNEIIDLLGYGGPLANNSSGITTKAKVNPWRIIKKVAPARLLYAIKETLPKAMQEKLLFLWYAGQQKYHGRRAFAVPNNEAVGTIRINLKGRDHEGVVNPNEYWSLCEEISNSLTELTDPITRRPVVKKITLLHKECHGEHLDILPDIAVYWDSSFAWGSLRSPRFGTLQITSQDRRTGTHTPNSFLLAVGLGLPARLELRGHSVLDVAPTILDGFDVPIPDRFDGRPLGFAFEKQANSNPQA